MEINSITPICQRCGEPMYLCTCSDNYEEFEEECFNSDEYITL